LVVSTDCDKGRDERAVGAAGKEIRIDLDVFQKNKLTGVMLIIFFSIGNISTYFTYDIFITFSHY
jgi:hypothetical protein